MKKKIGQRLKRKEVPMRLPPIAIAGIVIAGILALGWMLSGDGSQQGAPTDEGTVPRLIYLVLLGLLFGAALIGRPQFKFSQGLGYIAIWIGVIFVILLAYSFRDDVGDIGRRVAGELAPSVAMTDSDGTVSLRRAANGHFMALADVRGPGGSGLPGPERTISFLVDTGASRVALSDADARALGIDTNRLVYDQIVRTANGETRAASIRLASVRLGAIEIQDVRAMVVSQGLDVSLLGLSFLDRVGRYTVNGDRLILSP